MEKWIEELKPGDSVIINNGIHKVERLTPTMIVLVSGSKFNRKTGHRVGDSGSWSTTYIHEATTEEINRINHIFKCQKFRNFDWKSLPLEILVNVENLIRTHVESEP